MAAAVSESLSWGGDLTLSGNNCNGTFEHDEWEHSSINGRYLEAFRTDVSTLRHELALSSERFSINLEMAR